MDTFLEVFRYSVLDATKADDLGHLLYPTEENPYFDMKIGIRYYRLRNQKYYDSDINYFWLHVDHENNKIHLLEPEMQSIFAIKDAEEREATQELIGEWLINTNTFKHSIRELINQKKAEIRQIIRTVELLEKRLELKTEDILKATVGKAS
jgi:hypothetical protein